MPTLSFTAKEIHLLVQAIRLSTETGELLDYGKNREIEQLKTKLQNVKDV